MQTELHLTSAVGTAQVRACIEDTYASIDLYENPHALEQGNGVVVFVNRTEALAIAIAAVEVYNALSQSDGIEVRCEIVPKLSL